MAAIPDAFHGEFSSADASALSEPNSRFSLFPPGSTSALTLNANDFVIVTDIVITTATNLTVTVYDGADNSAGTGETLAKTIVNGTGQIILPSPRVCQKGTWPKIKTSGAGQIDCAMGGAIYRNTL